MTGTLITAIVFLPLLGALIAGLFGKFLGARTCEILTTSFLFLAAAFSWVIFLGIFLHEGEALPASITLLATWFQSGDLNVTWALRVDTLTAVMLVVVNSVSSLVHLYSIGYMHEDKARPRFFAYLSLFTFAMLMLITSDNLVQMFFGWEGVGLASYLLIGFWYEKPSACAAAIKAFVVNRVGDFGFALGIFLVFVLTNAVAFDAVFAAAPGLANKTIHVFWFSGDALTIACLLLFMGAMGKSAQFLLHTWLPDAMEGPTPVSALIHAATMVTAGVFMVARLSPLFEQAPVALSFVTIIGATTALFAATVGLVQNDIKRVIAYSTCSQLGYMFVALGVGGYSLGIFHLFTHAFFKALLFLGAGSVIHALHHEQDMRNMGGLRKAIPVTFWTMTIGTLALTGFPFTAGFYSKDAIIEAAFASTRFGAGYAFFCVVLAAGLTSFYSWRLAFRVFFGARQAHDDAHHAQVPSHNDPGHDDDSHHHTSHAHAPHESPSVMLIPLLVLSVGALFAGYIFGDAFIGHHAEHFWGTSLYYSHDNHILHDMHDVTLGIGLAPTIFMALGFFVALQFYILKPGSADALAQRNSALYQFLLNKWYFDELYDLIFVRPARWIGRLFWKGGDGFIIDRLGPDGISGRVIALAGRTVRLQTGYIYHYAFAMLIGVAALMTWMLMRGL